MFWLGKLTPTNPKGNRPRSPLVIGEVDRRSGPLSNDTVRTIDDRQPGECVVISSIGTLAATDGGRIRERLESMTYYRLFLTSAVCTLVTFQQVRAEKSRKDVPLAPLPSKVSLARKAFVANGGGNDLAFDSFYAAFKRWSRYELVDSPDAAEIIFEIGYFTEDRGTRIWSTTNTTIGATSVHSRRLVDPQLVLTIFDPLSKQQLWSTVEHRRLARLGRNREKETIKAAERLVEGLKARLGTK